MTSGTPRIGVAISGGGFRATACGLGCLRALHDTGLLAHVTVISGISGGSLLTALYAYGAQDFSAFDDATTELLHDGLQGALIRRTLSPQTAAKNIISTGRAIMPDRGAARTAPTRCATNWPTASSAAVPSVKLLTQAWMSC
jgi:predicted acylesterase/phospholipase RssA